MNRAWRQESKETRKQGNKIMVTVPKSFNVDAGVKLRPRLTSKGIFYEFVDGNAFLDFDEEILNDLVTHEYDGQELVKKFKSIKCYFTPCNG